MDRVWGKSFVDTARWIDCGFVVDGDATDTIHREPTLAMYQSVEVVLSIVWDRNGGCSVITDKNSYTFLPF